MGLSSAAKLEALRENKVARYVCNETPATRHGELRKANFRKYGSVFIRFYMKRATGVINLAALT